MPSSDTIGCTSAMTGAIVQIPISEIKDRPSVYGIIWRGDRLLMMRSALTGRLFLPGGGIDPGEDAKEALLREIREETGRDCNVGEFWSSYMNYVYADFEDTSWKQAHPEYVNAAWRVELALYECELVGEANSLTTHDPDEGQPEWVDVRDLDPDELQDIAKIIVPVLIAEHFQALHSSD